MTTPTILVTGGAGFIGSNVVANLTEGGGCDVVVCDRLRESASGKWRNLAKHPIADFVHPEQLSGWLQATAGSVDVVIHMGAVSSTLETDADKIMANNFALSRDLFQVHLRLLRRHLRRWRARIR
jgi:ADP-L-glycero-D-manno-heptose 6-epimerase